MNKGVMFYMLKFAKWLRFIPGANLFRPIYSKILNRNRKNAIAKNGIKVLFEFDKVLLDNNIFYSVYAGTMLGAIREKGFIKHDLDLDTVMFCDDYKPQNKLLLEKAGFKLIRTFLANEGRTAREETYEKDGVCIDIFYAYKDEKYPSYVCEFQAIGEYNFQDSMKKYGYVNVRRFEYPIKKEVMRVPFESIEVNILTNAKEWLSSRYGSDYMIPNPGFKDKKENPHIYIWKGMKGVMHAF